LTSTWPTPDALATWWAGGLGTSTIADRAVQAALKLVVEPIFDGRFSAVS